MQNTSLVREVHKSPVVTFKTLNGLKSPLYTFDSGRILPTALTDSYPVFMYTNGTKVSSGGNPSNALQLDNTKHITSASVKPYANAELKFDMIFPSNIDSLFGGVVTHFYDKQANKHPGTVAYATGVTTSTPIWTFKSGDVKVVLTYVHPYLTSDQNNYTTPGKWTLTPCQIQLVVYGNISEMPYTDNNVKLSNVFLSSKLDSTGGVSLTDGTTTYAMIFNRVTTKLDANASWLTPYAATIKLYQNISAKMGSVAEVSMPVTALSEKYNGYKGFVFTSGRNGLLFDNVQYTVLGGDVSKYVRFIE